MATLRALLRLSLVVLALLVHTPAALLVLLASRAPWARVRRGALRAGPAVQASWARWTLRACGVRLDLEGPPPRGPLLVVSNHLSWLDIPVLAAVFQGRFVAKGEIARWPLFGPLASSVGTIFLERGRARHVLEGGEAMRASLFEGCSVVVFPEGSNDRGERVRPFKSAMLQAAADLALPCLPVALGYSAPGSPWAPAYTVCWWGNESLARHMWRFLALPRVVARVRFAEEPLPPMDRKALAEQAQAEVSARFEPVRQEPPPPWMEGEELRESSAAGS
jgi:1-acyl-sn-glycerol-3-phosphate acyltransferase